MSEATRTRMPGGFRAAVDLLRRNREFRRLYLASVVSLGGDWFLIVAIFGRVLDLTDSPFAIGLVIAAQDITYFLLSPISGVLADRLDRKRLMIVADLARAVVVVGFLFVDSAEIVWVAFVLLGVRATFSALFEPASAAAMPNLVGRDDLSLANALAGSLWGTMLAIGASVGGVVTALVGYEAAVLVDAASFLVSALLLMGIRAPLTLERGPHVGAIEATVETARYARRDHRVLALLMVKFGWGLSGGVLALIPIVAAGFGATQIGIGLLMASRGVGSLIGPFIGRSVVSRDERRLFGSIATAQGVFGLGYVLLGLAPALALAVPSVMLAHTGGGAQWTLSSYGLQRIVPDRIRGRIFGFDGMLVTLTFGFSSVATGWLAQTIGADETAYLMGAISVAWALGWTWATSSVRGRSLEPDPNAAAAA